MSLLYRQIQKELTRDADKKIIVLAGPRQCGKTTLARQLFKKFDYLNYDNLDDRSQLLRKQWNRTVDAVVLDEIHKLPKWKSWIKGIYDVEGNRPRLILTGSSQMNTFKKVGDSLAGRHFYYRLHPFDLKEVYANNSKQDPEKILLQLFNVSGYPEPFLTNDVGFYKKWRQSHLNMIIKNDLYDYESVSDIHSVEILIEQLRSRVASGISVNALATDLQKDPKTIQRWLNILEDLFIIFKLTPYSKDISRGLKKEPKYYFYDTAMVSADDGAKLENAVACSLLKETHRLLDCHGVNFKLHYLKVKGGKEIDFAIIPEAKDQSAYLIETKWSDTDASSNFKLFENTFRNCKKIQLVGKIKRNFSTANNIHVTSAADWLADFDLFK